MEDRLAKRDPAYAATIDLRENILSSSQLESHIHNF
jgi:hypothetical protein